MPEQREKQVQLKRLEEICNKIVSSEDFVELIEAYSEFYDFSENVFVLSRGSKCVAHGIEGERDTFRKIRDHSVAFKIKAEEAQKTTQEQNAQTQERGPASREEGGIVNKC